MPVDSLDHGVDDSKDDPLLGATKSVICDGKTHGSFPEANIGVSAHDAKTPEEVGTIEDDTLIRDGPTELGKKSKEKIGNHTPGTNKVRIGNVNRGDIR